LSSVSLRAPAETLKKGLFAVFAAALTWLFWPVIGCRHTHPTLPFNGRQTCLDCGSLRPYLFHTNVEHAAAGIFIGSEKQHLRSAIRSDNVYSVYLDHLEFVSIFAIRYAMASSKAIVFNHVAFEDLGSLAEPLIERGFEIRSVDVPCTTFPIQEAYSCDLLIVLGGPIGVYDQKDYPFLTDEIALIRTRLLARKPTLGICLGAQLMAAALGTRVYPGANGKEIGWATIQPIPVPDCPEWFAPLLKPDLPVLHWHGDTFDLPAGAQHLAKSDLYPNQAFAIENFALGLQFHPEVTAAGMERWYVGHACELSAAGLAVTKLRSDTKQYAAALQQAAKIFWNRWLDYIL
jgi:GMP synthase (glutamine-hydrolysing)